MKIDLDDDKPIYLQIADGIEDDILNGLIKENGQVMSTNQFASLYGINPATAGKGLNLLVSEGILFKKRGIGMFVKEGAEKQIKEKRKKSFFNDYVVSMVKEAKRLDIPMEDIIKMLKDNE